MAEEEVANLIPGVVASTVAFIAGACLLLDDAKDLGDFSRPDHPDPYHHWIWGAILLLAGVAGIGSSAMALLVNGNGDGKDLKGVLKTLSR
jgi:NhaP-type Na+/H+ or K+/H+ antiporter